MRYRRAIRLFLLMLALISSGCVSTPTIKVENMIPSVTYLKTSTSDQTLKLTKVTGGTEPPLLCCTYQEVKVDNTSFYQAALMTLQNSRLFKNVISDGNSDYELVTEIAAQENDIVGVLTYSTHLLVNYYLIDKRTNKELWNTHIFSQSTEKGSFTDADQALLRMNENAVRENLSQFIAKLSLFVDSTQIMKKVTSDRP